MIRGGNLLLQTPQSRQTNFQWGAEVSGINDLICHKIFLCAFLPLMCDIRAASSILTTLTSLEQLLHIATVSFFPNPMLEPFMF